MNHHSCNGWERDVACVARSRNEVKFLFVFLFCDTSTVSHLISQQLGAREFEVIGITTTIMMYCMSVGQA